MDSFNLCKYNDLPSSEQKEKNSSEDQSFVFECTRERTAIFYGKCICYSLLNTSHVLGLMSNGKSIDFY